MNVKLSRFSEVMLLSLVRMPEKIQDLYGVASCEWRGSYTPEEIIKLALIRFYQTVTPDGGD